MVGSGNIGAAMVPRFNDASLNKYCLEYEYEELEHATNTFGPENLLGRGSYGSVYRGCQRDATEVAIKVLEVPEDSGFGEEAQVLSKFRHPNLVILMGFARHGTKRCLIYEMMTGGDVEQRLATSNRGGELFLWRSRVNAAFDAACGLSHLHSLNPKVFHRDIKSPNILLDRYGNAKMADFGLACLSYCAAQKVKTTAGTTGYACPIYARDGVVTESSEVYSFGMVLFEILTASLPAWLSAGPDGKQEYQFLVAYICGDISRALSIADLRAQWPQEPARAVAELGLLCISSDAPRPSFVDVVHYLRGVLNMSYSQDAPVPLSCVPLRVVEAEVVAKDPNLDQDGAIAQLSDSAGTPAVCRDDLLPDVRGVPPEEEITLSMSWTLTCCFSEKIPLAVLNAIPEDQRVLGYRQGFREPLRLEPIIVGRSRHDSFFRRLVPADDLWGMVSREHFRIDYDRTHTTSPSVVITNLSNNCSMVNATLLEERGASTSLHDGDTISIGRFIVGAQRPCYTPFIMFRFSLVLSSSGVTESEATYDSHGCEFVMSAHGRIGGA